MYTFRLYLLSKCVDNKYFVNCWSVVDQAICLNKNTFPRILNKGK